MKRNFSTEAKVGVFMLIGLLLLAYMSLQVGESIWGKGNSYLVKAHFDYVYGLVKGAPVKVAGVGIGSVDSISLDGGVVLVVMRVKSAVKIPSDSLVSIKTQGVMGEKFIDIKLGTRYDDILENGGEILNSKSSADLESILENVGIIAEDIGGVTSSLNKSFTQGGGAGEIGSIIGNIALLANRLNLLLARNEGKIEQTIEELRAASAEMNKAFAAINAISAEAQQGKGMLGKIVADPEMANKFEDSVASLSRITARLEENNGTIGKLLHDDEMGRNLEKTIAGLHDYIEKAERLRTSIHYHGEFLTNSSEFKSHLNVRIQPRFDYFYQLGVTMSPRGRHTSKEIYVDGKFSSVEEWDKSGLLFNALLGKRFHDVVLRGGIMESSGGVGIDYFALDDKLKFSFDAFDFSDERRAHLKAKAEYRLFKGLYFSVGYDDFINNNPSPFIGFSLYFDDDDIKTVMSGIPIMK